MANEKRPLHPVQARGLWPPPDRGYEYSVLDTDDWWSVARMFGIDVWKLIWYNFQTNVPEEVNWYLRELVGCKQETPNGRNYVFRGADPRKRKIYIPPGYVTRVDATTEEQVVEHLKREAESSNDPRRPRFLCFLSKLQNGADDRVIFWDDVAPDPKIPAPAGVKRRSIGAPTVTTEWLFENIKSWEDVDRQPVRSMRVGFGKFVTSLRKALIDPDVATLIVFQSMHDAIIATHDNLEKWANWPGGGSSGMPRDYRAIKDWVRRQESDPKSVLNCVITSGR